MEFLAQTFCPEYINIDRTWMFSQPEMQCQFILIAFTCAGFNVESISFGAMMHDKDPDAIVTELNELN